MDSWIPFLCGTMIGSVVTTIAFVVIIAKGSKKDIVDVDPEIEEAEKQWKEQSKGY
jgi:hypothetical protein